MSKKFEETVFEYNKTIQRGELILVEYTSSEPIHLVVYLLLRYLKKENIPFIIIDIADQLHVLKAHLKFAGINTKLIDEAQVIKLGGAITTGSVLERISLTLEPSVMKNEFVKILKQLAEKHDYFVRIGLGTEKLIKLLSEDPATLEAFFGSMVRPLLGYEKSTGVVFMNTGIIREDIVQEAEEIASRVFEVKLEEGEITFRVVKSINFNEHGKTLSIKAQELQEYFASVE
ncbi:DUF257 family protein [Thermococcus alcaliphilus]|uniref:DUF257 family protein n=1 Tax=Thermococcus alcaliphilus TaxID=139207 RepID=UPI0020911C80|nr:DUF257 family protein [Thermococcus alcaliphilus]MCO6040365.1 DUF257 domain-containing protein [Thermococcus alcaliphilus]